MVLLKSKIGLKGVFLCLNLSDLKIFLIADSEIFVTFSGDQALSILDRLKNSEALLDMIMGTIKLYRVMG